MHGKLHLRASSTHHSFGLSEVVGEEDGVVISRTIEVLDYVVLCFDGGKEVTWDDFGTLVDELVEGVLAILYGSDLSKKDCS
jgi:hypothetical protein